MLEAVRDFGKAYNEHFVSKFKKVKAENELNEAGAGSEYESKGYLIAVTPFTYEAEFMDDIDSDIEE